MSPVLSRRRALLGSAAAAIGIGVPAAIASPAEAATAASPEAAALLREFHDVAGLFNAAGECLDKVITATARVPEPEALFARGQDYLDAGLHSGSTTLDGAALHLRRGQADRPSFARCRTATAVVPTAATKS